MKHHHIAQALVALVGAKPTLYVAGSAHIGGRTLTWTEKCSVRCVHDNECHITRSAHIPSGPIAEVDS